MKKSLIKILSVLILGVCLASIKIGTSEAVNTEKYSRIIWEYLELLCEFGPRNPGSKGYFETIDLIRRVGKKYADRFVEKPFLVQASEEKNIRMLNLELQFAGTKGGAPILIGSHFDTRPFADREKDSQKKKQTYTWS